MAIAMTETPFFRYEADRLVLQVRVQPGARDTRITGVIHGELRLRLQAPASDGRANQALQDFLAERLGTARSRVVIIRGHASRSKTISVRCATRLPEMLLMR